MEALKAIKIIGNQKLWKGCFLFLPNTGLQRVLNFMRDPKLAHILVFTCYETHPVHSKWAIIPVLLVL